MTKLGWTILILFVLAGLALASTLSFGPAGEKVAARRVVPAPVPVRAGDPLQLTVPVFGMTPGELADTWGQSRSGGIRRHGGIDIMAPGGTAVVAAAAGTVEKLFRSDAGGTTVYVRSPDRGWSYYYAHLAGYARGLREGQRVQAGELIGYVGDTGNAGAGNTHLHFAVARMGKADRWYGGEPVNPYPLLAGGGAGR